MIKIEHLGIAVKDAAKAKEVFRKLLGADAYKEEAVASESVNTIFFQLGESKLELLEATDPNSAIYKYLEKNREGIHHMAVAVDDIYAEIIRLKKEGFVFINEEPKKGADNKLIAFIHPKSANGILLELCQEINPT
ncbi:MAG TPA: methylmalonyl-CoA epimerase [Flavobacteriales bacterium]|jgi:methylmalonyl-CoA/ethylmalonyl-CoA epimerase|nr:methylmalonyl-CoA epimerase [Salibacteraceae bacterium]HAS36898.1 methylmalonyl-CoA epimerase [Flavobacteriales bacterium]